MYQQLKTAALEFIYTGDSILKAREHLVNSIDHAHPSNHHLQLLVDVSVIIKNDARTGIQRVVRAILSELQKNPPKNYKICPIFASDTHGYHYVPDGFQLGSYDANILLAPSRMVRVANGDVFLGLDLSAALLPKHEMQLRRWKLKGAKIYVVVYDLLPVLHPNWFNAKTSRNFYKWLRCIAINADGAICISNAVKAELSSWVAEKYKISNSDLPISVIPMGCDIKSSMPSSGLPKNSSELIDSISSRPTIMLVGTLEPRKGHQFVLDAFERIWRSGREYNLIFVGKKGWKVRTLIERINSHKEKNRKLFWIDDASDEFLESIYKNSFGLIVASEGEGFGLPIIEAKNYGIQILARNLPLFKEFDFNIKYFNRELKCPDVLARIIQEWVEQKGTYNPPYSQALWSHSVSVLLNTFKC